VIDYVLSPVFVEQGPPEIVAKAKAAWPQIEKAKSAILAGSLKVPFKTDL
jgi:basic membrane protein A